MQETGAVARWLRDVVVGGEGVGLRVWPHAWMHEQGREKCARMCHKVEMKCSQQHMLCGSACAAAVACQLCVANC